MQTIPDSSALLNAEQLEELEARVLLDAEYPPEAVMAELPGLTLPDAVTTLRRIAYHKRDQARIQSEAVAMIAPLQAQIDQIKAWAADQMEDRQRRIAIHEGRLQVFYLFNPPIKGKTVKLPGGSISCKSSDKWAYGDEKALVPLVKANAPDMIRTKTIEELDKNNFKAKAVIRDGKVFVANSNGELIELPVTVTTETTYKVELE